MIDVPRRECDKLIERWRRDQKTLEDCAVYERLENINNGERLNQMASVYAGCARALEIVLETTEGDEYEG